MCDNPGVVGFGIVGDHEPRWVVTTPHYYYLQLAKVLNPAGASATLAVTETDALRDWQDINELKRFVCAFPPDTPEKRPRLG